MRIFYDNAVRSFYGSDSYNYKIRNTNTHYYRCENVTDNIYNLSILKILTMFLKLPCLQSYIHLAETLIFFYYSHGFSSNRLSINRFRNGVVYLVIPSFAAYNKSANFICVNVNSNVDIIIT